MKNLISIAVAGTVMMSSGEAQTILSEDFEQGLPSTWAVGITIPAFTTWHALAAGECGATTAAAGFTGENCGTAARSFPSSSFLMTPELFLPGAGPYLIEFDSTLSMNLFEDDVQLWVTDDQSNQVLILDGNSLANTGVTERVSATIPNSLGGNTITIGFGGTATFAGTGGLGWIIDNVEISETPAANAYCFGDGVMNSCPCGNSVPAGTGSGCLNSTGGGATLVSSGSVSVAGDTLQMDVSGGPPGALGILVSGDNQLPNSMPGVGTPVFDGLRCAGGNLRRHGGRVFDSNGQNPAPWGGDGNPAIGLIAQGSFVAGQTRHWQVFYRDLDTQVCQSGRNFTNAVSTTFVP